MPSLRALLLLINLVGGVAVLGSYAWGISGHPQPGAVLWGNVPLALRPLYTVSMFSAAAGYLAFTYVLLLRVDAATARIGGFGFGLLLVLHLLVLVPSALWMPLTFRFAAAPSEGLWIAIRGVLLLVGLGALGLIYALLRLTPPPELRWLAIAGSLAFAVQTALLDGLVWPAYYR